MRVPPAGFGPGSAVSILLRMRFDRQGYRVMAGGVLVVVVIGGALSLQRGVGRSDDGAGVVAGASASGSDGVTAASDPVSGTPSGTPSMAESASASATASSAQPSQHTTTAAHAPTTSRSGGGTSGGGASGGSSGTGLDDPRKKEIAMELVSSAENSSLNWRAQYSYIEDIHDGRGYTGGIIGFCSGTGDMLQVVRHFGQLEPGNVLAKYLPALQADNGSESHTGLDPNFVKDWKMAAGDPLFQQSQDWERDSEYFDPAVSQAKADGLGTLGQFVYYDAMVMHGPGSDSLSFGGLRSAAMKRAKTPAQGGDETAYLNAYLDVRRAVMKSQPAWSDTSRIDTEQRVFVQAGNLGLNTPLRWSTYGDPYSMG